MDKSKKFVILALITGILIIIAAPITKYCNAIRLQKSGNLEEAYAILDSLGNFGNCKEFKTEIRNEINYLDANQFIENGQFDDAYYSLSKVNDYKDSEELKRQLEQEDPHLSIISSSVGDVVILGEYEQDSNDSNGKEPIEWIVLNNENGNVYLLSKYVLDVQPFNTENSRECSLDDWLETTFSEIAFENVREEVITRIGLMRIQDFLDYDISWEYKKAKYTRYAMKQDPQEGSMSGLLWWAVADRGNYYAEGAFGEDGDSYICDVTERCGVRPVVWIYANYDEIPPKPVFSGMSYEEKTFKSSGSSVCSSCNGTGKKLVTWYSEGNWGATSYSNYKCTVCGGDGKK